MRRQTRRRVRHGAFVAERTDDREHPEFWALYMGRGYSRLAQRRFPEAVADFEKGRGMNPDNTINLSGLAAAQAASGNSPAAAKVLSDMLEMRRHRYVWPLDLKCFYSWTATLPSPA